MEKVSFLTGFPGFGIDFNVYYKRKILLLFLKGSWYNNRTDNSIPGGGRLWCRHAGSISIQQKWVPF